MRIAAWACVLAVASGCAAHRGPLAPVPATGTLAVRHRADQEARALRAACAQAEATVWVRARARALPGASVQLYLAPPDAVRLRVQSALGTALDVAARADTLKAFFPRDRRALVVNAADSLDFAALGAMSYRALTASWRAPAEAWTAAEAHGAGARLRWIEEGDTLTLAIDGAARPEWVRVGRPSGGATVRYTRWERHGGVEWPVHVEIREPENGFSIVARIHRVRFDPATDASRIALAVPRDARPLALAELRRVLDPTGSTP